MSRASGPVSGANGIAIAPVSEPGLDDAVTSAGGQLVVPEEAAGVIWTNPADPQSLKELLASSPARWVQLPFAGIESFVAAGVLDPSRTWTCAKGIYGHACAEHALALMLAAARRIHHHVRERRWTGTAGLGAPERRLKDATVLIVGTGGIGTWLKDMLVPIGSEILAVNRSGRPLDGARDTVPVKRLDEVVPRADFVVLCAALTPETRGMFDRKRLARMQRHAWLVNVARGPLVVTDDLVDALREGSLGGAALDVTDPEPLPDGHPLWDLDDVVVTPHVANTWDMALPDLRGLVGRNVAAFVEGRALEGVVDPRLGY